MNECYLHNLCSCVLYRLLQEEKDSAEMKAQEIESQVGSQRLDALSDRWRSTDQPSPPISGRSTPTRQNSIDTASKYNTVSTLLIEIIALFRSCVLNSKTEFTE